MLVVIWFGCANCAHRFSVCQPNFQVANDDAKLSAILKRGMTLPEAHQAIGWPIPALSESPWIVPAINFTEPCLSRLFPGKVVVLVFAPDTQAKDRLVSWRLDRKEDYPVLVRYGDHYLHTADSP
jgi:hypothetical protein